MLTEPFESDRTKSWSQLSELVKDVFRKVNECQNRPSFSFKLSSLVDDGQQIGVRLYCLGSINNSLESTLVYCDVMNSELEQMVSANEQASNDEHDEDNLQLPTFKWKELICAELIKEEGFNERLSNEEKLQLQRKRMLVTGITSYEFHEKQKRFLFTLDGSLHYFDDCGTAPYVPIKLTSEQSSGKINLSICPSNPNLVAYVSGVDIFVINIKTGIEQRLTNNKIDQPDRLISSGQPSYIVQEEFDRLIGFWWQPNNQDKSSDEYKILFEQVDETDVELVKISSCDGTVEEYRYPKPGKKNATSMLKIASFKLDTNSNEFYDVNVNLINNINNLKSIYPDCEYLINCGWHNQDTILVQLLNRIQRNLLVFLISLDGSFETQCIYEEISHRWVNTARICEFIRENENESLKVGKELSFIWASQESGYRHLYRISVRLTQSSEISQQSDLLRSALLSKIPLTSGQYEVDADSAWLDNKNNLLYFVGLKDTPLENHLYVLSLDSEQESIKRLTTPGYSNSLIVFNNQTNMFINIQSSIKKPAFGFLNIIQNTDNNSDQLPSTQRVGYVISNKITKSDGSIVNCIEQFEMLPGFSRPELFSYRLKESGDLIYGLIYKPDFMQADKKYPCVLEVYGGPDVQLVSNSFRTVRQWHRHLLASQGYVVVAMDCRGSSNRGTDFESHLNRRLGQVEVQDQVEVLLWLAENQNYIDLNRIAVHGGSYGGYLALLCYGMRPDIFRLSIPMAPVTNWQLYDTGYTERYMDIPENNMEGYAKGSVINYVNNFPNEENRLLIVHGLMDENVHFAHTAELINELIKANKPYDLQVFPHERHSFTNQQARLYKLTILLKFLNQNL